MEVLEWIFLNLLYLGVFGKLFLGCYRNLNEVFKYLWRFGDGRFKYLLKFMLFLGFYCLELIDVIVVVLFSCIL